MRVKTSYDTDIDKTITGLEVCLSRKGCIYCPYYRYSDCCEGPAENEQLLHDALNLLIEWKKEQERNPVIVCPNCGKRVK